MAAESVHHSDHAADATAAQALSYARFASLPLFDAPRAGLHSPLLMQTWSAAIAAYWLAALEAGSLDPSKPLYVLDLAPSDGQAAWLMLDAWRRLPGLSRAQLHPCYVACASDADQLAAFAGNPWLAGEIAEGRIDTAQWQGDGPLVLRAAGCSILRTDNPVAVLALEWLQGLPAELYAVHHGQVLEGWARWQQAQSSDSPCALAYEWRTPMAEPQPPTAEALLAHYLKRFTSAALTLPCAACAATDAWSRLSGGRYLLLAADAGIASEQALRLGAATPPDDWQAGDSPLPVNFDALAWHQRDQGARVWNRQLDEQGIVLHLALQDSGHALPEACFDSLQARLEQAHPDDCLQLRTDLVRLADQLSAPAILALLRRSQDDPRLLQAALPALRVHGAAIAGAARREWQAVLERCWWNYLPSARDGAFYHEIGVFAAELGHWGLAADCFRTGLSMFGAHPGDLHHLAYCQIASGACAQAQTLIAQALSLEPDDAACLALQSVLAVRLQYWQRIGWDPTSAPRDTELVLEPLDSEHAANLSYQFRDPQIGVMTRLPPMDTAEEAAEWIASQHDDPARLSYAVMHASWGFVGVVSLHRAADCAFFYFWIGSDFQDAGLGRRAAELLLAGASKFGIAHVYTSAYADNHRSRAALDKLGFAGLPSQAAAPDETLLFFHRGADGTIADLHARLVSLCTAIDSPMRFGAASAAILTT